MQPAHHFRYAASTQPPRRLHVVPTKPPYLCTQPLRPSMIFLSYVKMHYSFVKSNIQRRWLNILCNYVHSRTFFTPDPSPSDHPARHLTLPATRPGPPAPPDPTRHPTRPATRPGPPPHPARHPTLPATPFLTSQPGPRRRRDRCDALVPSSSFCEGCMCGVKVI